MPHADPDRNHPMDDVALESIKAGRVCVHGVEEEEGA